MAIHSILCVLVFCLSCMLWVFGEEATTDIRGEFSMDGGSLCKYMVMELEGDLEVVRGFRLKCSCKSARTSKKLTYSCVYFGNPYTCPEFRTDEGAAKFYDDLAEYVKNRGSHACMHKIINSSKVSSICDGYDVPLRRSDVVNGDDPRLCGTQEHTEL